MATKKNTQAQVSVTQELVDGIYAQLTPIAEAASAMGLGIQGYGNVLDNESDPRNEGVQQIRFGRSRYVVTATLQQAVEKNKVLIEERLAKKEAAKVKAEQRKEAREAKKEAQRATIETMLGLVDNFNITAENAKAFDTSILAAKAIKLGVPEEEALAANKKALLVLLQERLG